jgi:hypothetical protein
MQQDVPYIWWLYMDADEFSHGPRGMTIREYLAQLDRRFRVVGTRAFNHYPTQQPHYIPGRHPADFQPLCEECSPPVCAQSHWKHPLQRYDADAQLLIASQGHHSVMGNQSLLLEPALPIFTHHFPYRDEEVTRRRLAFFSSEASPGHSRGALQEAGIDKSNMARRAGNLDAIYGQRWDEAGTQCGGWRIGVDPRPWTELVGSEDASFARWYPSEQL